jgi:hypothetical protein
MKRKSIYRRKLTRALRSTFKQYNKLQSSTAEEACQRLRERSYRKGKY